MKGKLMVAGLALVAVCASAAEKHSALCTTLGTGKYEGSTTLYLTQVDKREDGSMYAAAVDNMSKVTHARWIPGKNGVFVSYPDGSDFLYSWDTFYGCDI